MLTTDNTLWSTWQGTLFDINIEYSFPYFGPIVWQLNLPFMMWRDSMAIRRRIDVEVVETLNTAVVFSVLSGTRFHWVSWLNSSILSRTDWIRHISLAISTNKSSFKLGWSYSLHGSRNFLNGLCARRRTPFVWERWMLNVSWGKRKPITAPSQWQTSFLIPNLTASPLKAYQYQKKDLICIQNLGSTRA